jgi:predicted extracellular nuclease
MMKRIPVGCAYFLAVLFFSTIVHADELFIAHWNVENLFDTEDDPAVKGDEEFTPDGPYHWTKARYNIKLKNLAKIIERMHHDQGPDVLGLCEIENRKVVEDLIAAINLPKREYKIIHQDSPSSRGIDCAIIYDAKVFELVDSKFHFVAAEHTRDIVEGHFRRNGAELYVFENHWPSRSHDGSFRMTAATTLRKRIDEISAAQNAPDIVVIGDLNDTPDDPSIKEGLRAVGNKDDVKPGMLLDTTFPIHAKHEGTHVFENKWFLLDHVIVSPGLLDKRGFRWQADSTVAITSTEQMFSPKGSDMIARPSRTYSGMGDIHNFHDTGYSDHLPVGCVIEQAGN